MTLRCPSFLQWLRHAGVAVARPGSLLLTLTALLVTTLAYLGVMLADDSLSLFAAEHMPELTPEALALVRQGIVQQSFFLASLLLGGLFCLAQGWRFSRRIWLLVLCFVALADLSQLLLPSVSLLVSLAVGTPLGDIPLEQWLPVLKHLVIGACFLMATPLLFLSSVSRWRRALRDPEAAARRPCRSGSLLAVGATVPTRPWSVNGAILIALAVSVIGSGALLLFWPDVTEHLQQQGMLADLDDGFVYAGIVGGVILVAVLCFFLGRGSDVARWSWALLTAYGVVAALGSAELVLASAPLYGLIGAALQLLAIVSVVLLFLPGSAAWFKAMKPAATLS
jgi:hypothetical protein